MRLIDADALKESMRGEFFDSVEEWTAIREIDEAPTIEPTEEFEWCHDCKEYDQEKHCCPRWTKVIRNTVAELEATYKPKRGEWIKSSAVDIAWGEKVYTCSNCGRKQDWKNNFCPNCGARMEGAGDESAL